jgi:[citrate (pro-3S)-lyase] ligase
MTPNTAGNPLDLNYLFFEFLLSGYEKTVRAGASFYLCASIHVNELLHLSDTEAYLKRIVFETTSNDPNKIPVGDYLTWFHSNPPHLAEVYKGIGQYCDAYVKQVFSGPKAYKDSRGLVTNYDYASTYVNVDGGLRRTTDAPPVHTNDVHLFGASQVYGFGNEDAHTVASFLQRSLNELHAADASFNPFRVLNYGVNGGTFESTTRRLLDAQIQANDVVIYFVPWLVSPQGLEEVFFKSRKMLDELLNLCICHGVPVIDLRPLFQRPHPHGEVFLDGGHVGYRGNIVISRKVFDVCFAAKHRWEQNKQRAKSLALEIALRDENSDESVLMNCRGLREYLDALTVHRQPGNTIGAIVVNCNPFTLGHQRLIAHASKQVDHLFVFVVQEDLSYFSFQDRYNMVLAGCSGFTNVKVLPGGQYIISTLTFQEYFNKDNVKDIAIDATKDISIFSRFIAKHLGITKRFVGNEPFCPITRQYNQQMQVLLQEYGVEFHIIERFEVQGTPVSASLVRRLLQEGRHDQLRQLVPQTTYDYLLLCGKMQPGNASGNRSS